MTRSFRHLRKGVVMSKNGKRRNSGSRSKSARTGSRTWSIRRKGRIQLVIVIIIPWLWILGDQILDWNPDRGESIAETTGTRKPTRGRSGPWGHITWQTIELKPPKDYVSVDICPSRIEPWIFPGFDRKDVLELFRSAGFDETQRSWLARALHCPGGDRPCRVHPSRLLQKQMTPGARSRIYEVLREYRVNGFIRQGSRAPVDQPEKLLDWSALTPKAFQVVSSLSYRSGDFTEFTDIAVACSLLPNDNDRLSLFKALLRETVLTGQLHVSNSTDIQDLLDFWGRGMRGKSVRALLASLADQPAGGRLDVSHLLPPFARARLYTYPEVDAPPYDCHWSALSFWNDQFDAPMDSPDDIQKLVRERYEPVPERNRLFGDMVVLTDITYRAIHSAIYVADDVFFTKNGRGLVSPWVLMRLKDIVNLYLTSRSIQVSYYRLKEEVEESE